MDECKLTQRKLDYLSGLNELDARHYVGLWAIELGWGGISKVNKLTGKAIDTIRRGIAEIKSNKKLKESGRIRRKGGGRKKIKEKNPKIKKDIKTILDQNTAGDPMSPLKWTNKSTYTIAKELNSKGEEISEDTVGRIIKQEGYTLQSNKKSKEGGNVEQRDSQFRYINKRVKSCARKRIPVISVDTKKKELVGNFKNAGKRWLKKGEAEEVNVYDFKSLSKGKVSPYGIYEILMNMGFVNVGISYDTAEFAVNSISRWWINIGKKNYPNAKELLICADSGGSNGNKNKLWRFCLYKFATKYNLKITICHYPSGTSKWNKIEHRMFSFISMNWRGKPLISFETIINLIEATRTKSGLKIKAKLDKRRYKKGKGKKIAKSEMKKIKIKEHSVNPKWNYTIN